MRKVFFALTIALLLYGCNSSKKLQQNLNSWVGSTKQQLIMSWGPPTQTTSDGSTGEILVYANRVYANFTTGTVDYYEYRMMYADAEGKIYHWLFKRNPNPPDRIDIRLLIL